MTQPAEQTIEQALAEFYEPDEIVRWLDSPHPDLGGVSPEDAIAVGHEHEVWAIIDRLQSGAYL